MNFFPCARQQEVATALHERRWPQACTSELRTHVENCPQCNEFVRVAQTLRQARHDAMPMARLAPPGILWWRAQLRRRNAEVERVEKPLVLVEALALVATLLVTAALAVAQRGNLLRWLADVSYPSVFRLDGLWTIEGGTIFWALLIGSGVMIGVLSGFAVYLVARSE